MLSVYGLKKDYDLKEILTNYQIKQKFSTILTHLNIKSKQTINPQLPYYINVNKIIHSKHG
jgi:uncharacterized protein YjbK